MENVFNNNPSNYIDMNNFFPVLNDKIGLTSEQWRIAIENSNYLYNHLGLSNVDIGNITTIFTPPSELADVEVTHREVEINGKVIDYFDYIFYIPTPKIETNLNTTFIDSIEDMGMELTTTPIYGTGKYSNIIIGYNFNFNAKLLNNIIQDSPNNDNVYGRKNGEWVEVVNKEVVSNDFTGPTVTSSIENTTNGVRFEKKFSNILFGRSETTTINGCNLNFINESWSETSSNSQNVRPKINGTEEMAYLSDITTAINNAITTVLNTEV